MKIEIWADYACPFCYIGETTLNQAIKKMGIQDEVEIVYKAFQLDPNAPKESKENTLSQLAQKYRVSISEAEKMVNNVVYHAQAVGLNLRFDILQETNTFDAHRLTKLAKNLKLEDELSEKLYQSHFELGKNIANHDFLLELGQLVGIDSSLIKNMLESDQFAQDVKRDIEEANRKSIHAVPYFLIDGKQSIKGAQPLENFIQILNEFKSK